LASGTVQVERLDSQAVPRQKKFLRLDIPDGKGEHAAEFLDAAFSIFLVEVQDDFGVSCGMKLMSALFQFRAKLGGVIALAVVGDPEIAVGAGHRLAATIA